MVIKCMFVSITSAWLSLARSRHRHMVPFGLGTMTKVLLHSAIPSIPISANIWCSCSLPIVGHMLCVLVAPGMASHHLSHVKKS